MVENLGFPRSLIAIEKELKELPHLKNKKVDPKRRVDILAYAKDIHPHFPLYPLIIIECKAEKINEDALRQVMSYNETVEAFFITLASKDNVKTFWLTKEKKYDSCPFLPTYKELITAVTR